MFEGGKFRRFFLIFRPWVILKRMSFFKKTIPEYQYRGAGEIFGAIRKNRLRLVNEGERGAYILKPTPSTGKNTALMPANEHLTMQMARQVFEIETAENALIFFQNEQPAYLTKRFDLKKDGSKWAKEDFASLAGRTHKPTELTINTKAIIWSCSTF
jgi:serine/threonine-protein kinase HipA